jgi:hypothetical protein
MTYDCVDTEKTKKINHFWPMSRMRPSHRPAAQQLKWLRPRLRTPAPTWAERSPKRCEPLNHIEQPHVETGRTKTRCRPVPHNPSHHFFSPASIPIARARARGDRRRSVEEAAPPACPLAGG